MKKFILCISLIIIVFFSGCTGMTKDIFVGNIANSMDSWDKKGITTEQKLQDLSSCWGKAKKIYPLENDSLDKQRTYFYDRCMLDKGYTYYPRGIDGKSASSCLYTNRDSPACKSVPLGRNIAF
ncbi:MAG: hypothetical protein WC253_08980 [Sulfurovaceae bacterium]|jgi:hypothetical protein